MSAKHQENDTPVKASHLLLVDCGVSSSGSRTLSVGGAPQVREMCTVPQEQCGVVTLCDLPGPQSRSTTGKKERALKGKGSIHVFPSHDSAIAAAGRGLTCSGSRTHPSPKRSQVGVHVVLPQGSIASFQNFWNQSKLMEVGREIHAQSRIKALRVRMRQLISPLIVIST